MKISVVTVCRNSAKTIGRTLESFFAQDHEDRELIVVDGASTDETLSIVKSFPADRMTLISEPDAGLYDAMNKGLRTFTGDAVGFLNSDDRFHDHRALSAIAAGLEDADIVYGDLDVVAPDDEGRVVRRWRSTPFRPGAFRYGWMPPHPTFYCRRPVVKRTGLFDPRYRIASDYDFMLRAMELGGFTSARVPRSWSTWPRADEARPACPPASATISKPSAPVAAGSAWAPWTTPCSPSRYARSRSSSRPPAPADEVTAVHPAPTRAADASASRGLYVQFGCGLSAPEGWLNFDASPRLKLERIPGVRALMAATTGTLFPAGLASWDIVAGFRSRTARAPAFMPATSSSTFPATASRLRCGTRPSYWPMGGYSVLSCRT
ncbi:MAG: glycosyltransferase family 2 protein [Caulobacteraceae bacterium]